MSLRGVFFLGPSGVGKSTLMHALAETWPESYRIPPRLTTRAPKAGDLPGELEYVTDAALDELARGEGLLLEMQQNARDPATTRSAYRVDALEPGGPVPLLFLSVFQLDDARSLPGVAVVHVRADWRAGLARRGGDTQPDRVRLNEDLAELFAPEALAGRVDVELTHDFEPVEEVAARLHARLAAQAGRLSPGPPASLGDAEPAVRCGNLRRALGEALDLDPAHLAVRPGRGHVGDLVLGEVPGRPEAPLLVWDAAGVPLSLEGPARVVVPLGTRESSTHVNGGVPPEGVRVGEEPLHWLAGESGLVGRLEGEAGSANALAEHAAPFRTLGRLVFPEGHPRAGAAVSLTDLARPVRAQRLTTPVVLIAATSAEAGKTTLCTTLLRELTARGHRVAACKLTGTGGTVDARKYREAGAVAAFDQVDAGLPTTYVPTEDFAPRATRPLRLAQDAGADLVLGELGGDLPWAGNPTLLRTPEVLENLAGVLVLANDSLAARGARSWLAAAAPGVPAEKVALVSSPFRNLVGQRRRAAALGLGELLDSDDARALADRVEGWTQAAPPAPPEDEPVDARDGQPGALVSWWRGAGVLGAALEVPAHERMPYELETEGRARSPAQRELEEVLRALHRHGGNAAVEGAELLLGVGARQLLVAAVFAHRQLAGTRLRLSARAPFYPLHARLAAMAPAQASWVGAPYAWDGGLAEAPVVEPDAPLLEVVCSPRNPLGDDPGPEHPGARLVHDMAYAWPHLVPEELPGLGPRAEELMVFSLSKCTGHAGTRLGWALVRDPALAEGMRRFVHHHTIGTSVEAQARARLLVGALLEGGGARWEELVETTRATMEARWEAVEDLLARAPDPPEVVGARRPWQYLVLRDRGGLASALEAAGVRAYPGDRMGAPELVRLNLGLTPEDFARLLPRLGQALGI